MKKLLVILLTLAMVISACTTGDGDATKTPSPGATPVPAGTPAPTGSASPAPGETGTPGATGTPAPTPIPGVTPTPSPTEGSKYNLIEAQSESECIGKGFGYSLGGVSGPTSEEDIKESLVRTHLSNFVYYSSQSESKVIENCGLEMDDACFFETEGFSLRVMVKSTKGCMKSEWRTEKFCREGYEIIEENPVKCCPEGMMLANDMYCIAGDEEYLTREEIDSAEKIVKTKEGTSKLYPNGMSVCGLNDNLAMPCPSDNPDGCNDEIDRSYPDCGFDFSDVCCDERADSGYLGCYYDSAYCTRINDSFADDCRGGKIQRSNVTGSNFCRYSYYVEKCPAPYTCQDKDEGSTPGYPPRFDEDGNQVYTYPADFKVEDDLPYMCPLGASNTITGNVGAGLAPSPEQKVGWCRQPKA